MVGEAVALPPESVLPTPPKALKPLPSESSLPGLARGQSASKALPGENTLPVNTKVPVDTNAADAAQQAIAELQDSRDQRVRLRLAVPEHTSSIYALAFDATSTHLFTGGDDKLVHHWRLRVVPDTGEQKWLHEESIRWQVGSGPSGSVRAVACQGDVLYMGGYGADGQKGEICRYDWVRKVWLKAWAVHYRPIVRLWAFPQFVVSLDEYGGLVRHAIDDAAPIQWLRNPQLALPSYYAFAVRPTATGVEWLEDSGLKPWSVKAIEQQGVGQQPVTRLLSPEPTPGTEMQIYDDFRGRMLKAFPKEPFDQNGIANLRTQRGDRPVHLAISPDGRQVAAIDNELNVDKIFGHWLYVWRDGKVIAKTRDLDGFLNADLAWSSDGKQLAVLRYKTEKGQSLSKVDLWNLEGKPVREELSNGFRNEYYSCEFSPDNSWLALGGRIAVTTISLKKKPSPNIRLPETLGVLPVTQVAFAKTGYQWRALTSDNSVSFDPQRMALVDLPQDTWQTPLDPATGWKFGDHQVVLQGKAWAVKRGNAVLGLLDEVDVAEPFRVTCAQWIGTGNQPTHLAIVYEKKISQEIHLYSLSQPVNGHLRRVGILNGHEGAVLSLSVSADQKVLISCGVDRQVMTWPLQALIANENSNAISWQRYGALFAFNAGQLQVSEVHPAGPLYEFGLRTGDQVTNVDWFRPSADRQTTQEQNVPLNECLTFLNQPDFNLPVRFTYTRQNGPVLKVLLKPQWRPLYGIAIDSQREWAAWTAAGFYAASFNGNTSFGWQINRGLSKPPSFYRADRFQAVLERPELLRRVIALGSVEAAAKEVGETLTSHFHPLQNAIANQPTVNVIAPVPGAAITGNRVEIVTEVELPKGSELASTKAFANAVPARLVSKTQLASTETVDRYRIVWSAGLPNDSQIKLQVLAANSHRIVGGAEVIVNRHASDPGRALPRLWLFAGAVGKFEDEQIPQLTTPERNVQDFARNVELATRGLYDVQSPTILTGSQMTRSQWKAVVTDQLEDLKPIVQPDDIVMIFLSGHGIQDEESGGYYYVPADVRMRDVNAGHYEQCLGVNEIAPFAGLACRKLVILDTCHSGSFQPLESDRLRSAVRTLQADLVLTLTASEGDQTAAEDPAKSNSVFTEVAVQLLTQPVDTNKDKVFSLDEFVRQIQDGVYKRATELQKSPALSQKPKFIPSELLPYVRIPITQTAPTSP